MQVQIALTQFLDCHKKRDSIIKIESKIYDIRALYILFIKFIRIPIFLFVTASDDRSRELVLSDSRMRIPLKLTELYQKTKRDLGGFLHFACSYLVEFILMHIRAPVEMINIFMNHITFK